MKRYVLLLMFFVVLGVNAQSTYEVAKLFSEDLSGTARFVGMGGSMGALGGDLSVMGTNPAGIALYRGNDVAISGSLNTVDSKVNYIGTTNKNDNTFASFDNIGIVLANSFFDSGLKYLNIGVNYRRRNNFSKEFEMSGAGGFNHNDEWVQLSQMYQMQQLFDLSTFDPLNISYKNYTNMQDYWLPLLGCDGGLLDDNGAPLYLPDAVCYYSEEKGGVNEFDCNLSVNIDDRVYLGVTMGFYDVNYSRYSYYGEDDADGPIYTLHNWYETVGSGFDIKLGAIIRPFEFSPFKFGVAVHSPTWYSLTDRSSALIEGPYDDLYMDTRDVDAYGDDYYVDYHLRTPWRFSASASYTFGSFLAVNAEYEYADYSDVGMSYAGGGDMIPMEEEFESNMYGVNTYRVGAELRLTDEFSLRCGYNYMSAPFKKDAAKYTISATDTNTEYQNTFEKNTVTLGMGYNNKHFYIDAAYKLSIHDSDFYPYYDNEIVNPAASVQNRQNQFVVTIGGRF